MRRPPQPFFSQGVHARRPYRRAWSESARVFEHEGTRSPEVLRVEGGCGQIRNSHLPTGRHGPSRVLGPQTVRALGVPRPPQKYSHENHGRTFRRILQGICKNRRQDYGLPFHESWRGRPRTRHAQYVYGIQAEPGLAIPQHGFSCLSRIRFSEELASIRLRAEGTQRVRK